MLLINLLMVNDGIFGLSCPTAKVHNILDYAKKAQQCCANNHNKEQITTTILTDFERTINEGS